MVANIKEIPWDGVYWIYLALVMKKWRVPVITAIKPGVLQTGRGKSSSIIWATPSPQEGLCFPIYVFVRRESLKKRYDFVKCSGVGF